MGNFVMETHLTIAMLTSGVFVVAFALAIMIGWQERLLHHSAQVSHEHADSWLNRLPPMLTMERLLVRVLVLGFLLMSFLIITGMIFSEQIGGAALHWNHKTVFTLLAWVLVGVLLIGRFVRGWRGTVLVRSTKISFILLFLAYVGTHFVLDMVLHRG